MTGNTRKIETVPGSREHPSAEHFFAAWFFLFLVFFFLLYATDLVPSGAAEIGDKLTVPLADGLEKWDKFLRSAAYPAGLSAPVSPSTEQAVVAPAVPRTAHGPSIIIPKVAISAPIIFPKTRNTGELNNALTQGVVHYPDSAMPGERGNVFLFGHSSGLAVVHNNAFAVFNRLQELAPGDIIRIRSGSHEYWYRVRSVTARKAKDTRIDLATDQKLLTLSTCNLFGNSTEDRFVVEGEFVKSYPLRS